MMRIVIVCLMALLLDVSGLAADSPTILNNRPARTDQTNLTAFAPYPFLIGNNVIATNGVEGSVEISDQPWPYDFHRRILAPPVCHIYVISHITNDFACLKMPATNLCRISLLNEQKEEVEKTEFGKMFGLPLSDDSIGEWRQRWIESQPENENHHQTVFVTVTSGPQSDPDYSRIPIQICDFSIKDAFKITRAGEYELRVQLRLVQSAKDPSGTLHFPITALPEVTIKVNIGPEEIP